VQRRILVPLVVAATAGAIGGGVASGFGFTDFTNVPKAELKAAGYSPATVLSPELRQHIVAEGSVALENPDGIVTNYGYENDVPSADDPSVPQMAPTPDNQKEPQKTEPDKNTYLVLQGQKGADPAYDYGTHFLFQGHEGGADVSGKTQGYITRINLDADDAHRVTLMATKTEDGEPIATIDGSTWDPFAERLLFTTESSSAPTYAATVTFPSQVEDVSGALGRGGYEGIQDDKNGNIWIVEDSGGAFKADASGANTTAKRPNSFPFRYVPASPGDLQHGKLQVLQVENTHGDPITYASQAALHAPDQVALHSYGQTYDTEWITVHDTAVDGTEPFNANTLAKAADGTPFKRPENGVFRPGTNFQEFYFTETGDTNVTSPENDEGGWCTIFKLEQDDPSADTGKLSVFYKGDEAHAGFDNVAFVSDDQLLAVEDAGDTLHTQRKALDSGYEFDATADYSVSGTNPVRFIAEGRDPAATLDSANDGFGSNEGDNEITGIHVSDGDPTTHGILGEKDPQFIGLDFGLGWRIFYTEQHGENRTYEITRQVGGGLRGN
jgi:hypothetical protein